MNLKPFARWYVHRSISTSFLDTLLCGPLRRAQASLFCCITT